MYILLKVEGGSGGKEREESEERITKQGCWRWKACLEFGCLRRWQKNVSLLCIVWLSSCPNMAVRLHGEWRLLLLKLLKAKSEITEYLSSQQKPSRASRLHTEWPRGSVGTGEKEERKEAWRRKACLRKMTCCMLSQHVHNKVND